MKGLLTLPHDLLCRFEVLGKCFNASIGLIPVKIYFPRYQEKIDPAGRAQIGISNELIPPEIAKNWSRGNEPLEWGWPVTYPDKDASVRLIALTYECDKSQEEEIAQYLYNEWEPWIESFFSFCDLASKQHSNRDRNLLNHSSEMELLSKDGYIKREQTHTIHCYFSSKDQMLTSSQIEGAIAFASSKKELKIEYQLLLSAYSSRRNCHNKHAIMDACAAVEICLNKVIQAFATTKDFDPNVLTQKYRTLGDKFKLIKTIDNHFPDVNEKQIVDLRNDVAHCRKITVSDEETDKLIDSVELCLAYCSPEYY